MLDRLIEPKENFLPLFDHEYQLKQVEFLGLSWLKKDKIWRCNFHHIACSEYGQFWANLTALPIDSPLEKLEAHHPILFKLENYKKALIWYWYPDQAFVTIALKTLV